jgi:uncharacterized protein (TIGR02453 family)
MKLADMDIQPLFSFLEELKENNHKEWFAEHKKRYELCRATFMELVEGFIAHLAEKDEAFEGVTAKACVFRIYRDVRFSKDKTPYKTSFSACIAPGGRKSTQAIRYLHLEPGNTMLAAGMYQPDADRLKKIRQEIDYNANELKEILSDSDFKKYFDGLNGDKLKRPPKGYDAEHPDIELLKFKSFTVFHKLEDKTVLSANFLSQAKDVFDTMELFNAYLNQATAD